MEPLDQDNDLLDSEISVPDTVSYSRREEYIKAVKDANKTDSQFLLFIRDDAKKPLSPITIDFLYKIVSINENYEKNTIIEMRDYSGETYKQQINVRVYKQDDPAVLTDIENPYIIRQPINNWVHFLFRYNASTCTWEAYYNEIRWFILKDSPKFSPKTINMIKVYTKIPYSEGGDFKAYIANLTISKTIKAIKYFPPYPRDYGPIFIGGIIQIIHIMIKNSRINVLVNPRIILWWPVREPIDIWETEFYGNFSQDYIYHSFKYGGNYIKYYYDFYPKVYGGGFWDRIPVVGPNHNTQNGVMTFRRGTVLGKIYEQSITIESWLYIKFTEHNGKMYNIYNFNGPYVNIRICFNGSYFRIYRNSSYWNIRMVNPMNRWIHFSCSYSYIYRRLRFFINGTRILTLNNINFVPKDIILYTRNLNSGIQFYHIGLCVTTGMKYSCNFNLIKYILPPYSLFPGQTGYNIPKPVLPPAPKSSIIFRYPVDVNNVNKYDSNGIYILNTNNNNLVKKINETKIYIYPIINNTIQNKTMNSNFIHSKIYKTPSTYTLEYWIYLSEDYVKPDKINMNYVHYNYFTLLAGGNGIYLGLHKKGSFRINVERTFTLDLKDKWTHIAMTCKDKTNFVLFVNGTKTYEQNNFNEIFNINQLYINLRKISANGENNIANIEMYDHIRYTDNFNYKNLRSKPYDEET